MMGLLRDLRTHRAWVIGIVILLGMTSGIYTSFKSTYDSGIETLEDAKDDARTAQIMVTTYAGEDLSTDMANVSGIAKVSPVHSADCYTIEDGKVVRGALEGVGIGDRVNGYSMVKGKDLEKSMDVVVDQHYAKKHGIDVGQRLTIYIDGGPKIMKVSGISFSPSYIYLISPEGLLESDFGIFYVSKEDVATTVNTYYIELEDGVKVDDTVSDIDGFLAAKGTNGVVKPTDKIFQYTAFKEDLKAMEALADLFTGILLIMTAFIVFVVISRLIDARRREIGTLRAMGFDKGYIFGYYMALGAVALLLSMILALPIGYGLLYFVLTVWGVNVLGIPAGLMVYDLNPIYLIYASASGLLFMFIGASIPAYRAASIRPAESMKPRMPSGRGKGFMIKATSSPLTKFALRDLLGHVIRSLSTVLMVAFLLSLALSLAFSIGSFDTAIDARFDNNESWDLRVAFDGPMNASALTSIGDILGVDAVEPYSGFGARISHDGKDVVVQFNQMIPDTSMHTFSLAEGKNDNRGILISGDVAHRLDLAPGDSVTVDTPTKVTVTTVSGIISEFGSSEAYMFGAGMNSTGALLKIEEGRVNGIEGELMNMPFVSSWMRKGEMREGWHSLMENYHGMIYAMDMIAVMLLIVVIGVLAFITTSEKEWDFVVLKALGFWDKEILGGFLVGNLSLTIAGAFLGVPMGMGLASEFNNTFSELMSPPPVGIMLDDTIVRVLLVVLVSLIATMVVVRKAFHGNVAARLRHVFETM